LHNNIFNTLVAMSSLRPALPLLFVWISLAATPARAQVAAPQAPYFNISNASVAPGTGEKVIATFYPALVNRGQGAAVEQQLNTNLGTYAAQLTNTVNQSLGNLQIDRFMGRTGNASTHVGKLLSFDHATDASIFSLTLGGGLAVNNFSSQQLTNVGNLGSNLANGSLPDLGGAGTASVLLGVQMRRFGLPTYRYFDFRRLALFVNFMNIERSFSTGALAAPIKTKYTTLGVHALYHLVDPHSVFPGGLLRWGGVSVGTGFDFTSLGVTTVAKLPSGSQSNPFAFAGQSLRADLAWSGNATLATDLGGFSVPIEFSTHVQLLYLLTLYTAVAADLNLGSSSIRAVGDEPVTVALRDPASGKSITVATPAANLTLASTRTPTVLDGRGVLGLQLNFGVLAVFAQASADTARNLGVAAGVRAFW
jgi:hypothetical protein